MAGKLTEYELLRRQIQERNAEKLRSLGVKSTVDELTSTVAQFKEQQAHERQQRVKAKRISKEAESPAPLRRSLRSRGLAPEMTASMDSDLTPTAGGVPIATQLAAAAPAAAPAVASVSPTEPVPLHSLNRSTEEDERLLRAFGVVTSRDGVELHAGEKREGGAEAGNEAEARGVKRLAVAGKRVGVGPVKGEEEAADAQGSKARGAAQPWAMALRESDVSRVAKDRIQNVLVMPFSDRLVVLAGDKNGHVAVWDRGALLPPAEGAEEEGEGAGVFKFAPHASSISGLAVSPADSSVVYSASYDGSVRALRPALSSFTPEFHTRQHPFSCLLAPPLSSPLAHALLLGTDHGDLLLLDPRAGGEASRGLVAEADLHPKKISTLSLCPAGPGEGLLLASCSMDCSVRLWDARRLPGVGEWMGAAGKKGGKAGGGAAVALCQAQHGRGVNSAYFSPDGAMLASTSYDDTIRVWKQPAWSGSVDASEAKEAVKTVTLPAKADVFCRHNNQTGRWVSSFRAVWGCDGRHLFVGGMGRSLDVLDAEEGCWRPAGGLTAPELMTNIPARLGVHPEAHVVAAGTASGRLYLFR